MVSILTRVLLRIQIILDWLAFLLVGLAVTFFIRYIRKNRFEGHDKLRRDFRNLTVGNRTPTLICSNHLNMFDSFYIQYALGDVWFYLRNFRLFSWNIPAIEKFKTTIFMRLFTYLGKCIAIDRNGSGEHHKQILNTLRFLLVRGEICTIFPEGGRSRTGRVDMESITYGVGSILQELDDYRVIVVYMRAETQQELSVLPPRGDTIHFDYRVITPRSDQHGRRGAREISIAVLSEIAKMEEGWFADRPSRTATDARQ